MSYLLWRAQDLANLEYGVYFAGAWEERSEGIKLCHDAANGPLVYVWTVGSGSEEHLRGSVPVKKKEQKLHHKHHGVGPLRENTSSEENSPSSGHVVSVRRSRSDFSGEPKVCYFHQLRTHAQEILWFHVPMEKPWEQKVFMSANKKCGTSRLQTISFYTVQL